MGSGPFRQITVAQTASSGSAHPMINLCIPNTLVSSHTVSADQTCIHPNLKLADGVELTLADTAELIIL